MAQDFADRLLERVGREDEGPRRTLEVIDDKVYIKDICDLQFVKDGTNAVASKMCCNVEYYEEGDSRDEVLYSLITQFVSNVLNVKVDNYGIAGYRVDNDKGIFIPTINGRYLNHYECEEINAKFRDINNIINKGFNVLNDMICCVQDDGVLFNSLVNKREFGVYGIDFFNYDIAGCVVNTIFENSMVKEIGNSEELSDNYELTIYNTKFLEHVIDDMCRLTPNNFKRIHSHSPDKNREQQRLREDSDSGLGSSRQTSTSTVLSRSVPSAGSSHSQYVGEKRASSAISSSESSESNSTAGTLSLLRRDGPSDDSCSGTSVNVTQVTSNSKSGGQRKN